MDAEAARELAEGGMGGMMSGLPGIGASKGSTKSKSRGVKKRKPKPDKAGETITIAAKKYATFKAAKGLKDRVAE